MTRKTNDAAFRTILAVFAGWTVILFGLTLADRFLPETWRFDVAPLDFAKTGAFGDSFGIISAAMASVAGYYAFKTYRSAQAELADARRRAGEPTFLDLLERRFTLVDRVTKGALTGVEAVQNICKGIRQGVELGSSPAEMFRDYTREAHGLRNLFRYTYHIIRFAEDLFGFDAKAVGADKRRNGSYPYVRLLRAQLSDEDLLLIALNSLHDPDGKDFRVLLDRYGLLDNMKVEDRHRYGLDKAFTGDEFGLPR